MRLTQTPSLLSFSSPKTQALSLERYIDKVRAMIPLHSETDPFFSQPTTWVLFFLHLEDERIFLQEPGLLRPGAGGSLPLLAKAPLFLPLGLQKESFPPFLILSFHNNSPPVPAGGLTTPGVRTSSPLVDSVHSPPLSQESVLARMSLPFPEAHDCIPATLQVREGSFPPLHGVAPDLSPSRPSEELFSCALRPMAVPRVCWIHLPPMAPSSSFLLPFRLFFFFAGESAIFARTPP